jgi:hypothetical protein
VGRHFTEIARTAATVFSILLTRSGIVRSRALRHPCLPGRGIVDGALSKEEALVGYCEDGDLEIDNNRAERSLRGIALFAAKGRTSAVLNGLLTICKRLYIDLFASNGLARSASFPANGRPSPERARQTAPGQNGRQHVPLRLFGAVMAVCLGISAQSGVTIQQVKEFIHSAFKQKQPDKQVDAALHTLKLSERLDERTVEELQAEGAGPKTVGALKELAARSAKLTATRLEFPGFLVL